MPCDHLGDGLADSVEEARVKFGFQRWALRDGVSLPGTVAFWESARMIGQHVFITLMSFRKLHLLYQARRQSVVWAFLDCIRLHVTAIRHDDEFSQRHTKDRSQGKRGMRLQMGR